MLKRRIAAFALSLVLAVGLAPGLAFAADGDALMLSPMSLDGSPTKALTVMNEKGAVTYKATKDVTDGAMKKVTVAKNGKVTVKKGTKAGAYKLKVKVTAAGDATYKKESKTVTLAVTVK